jgi:DNA (cytosine-5)-methyltransferase 1
MMPKKPDLSAPQLAPPFSFSVEGDRLIQSLNSTATDALATIGAPSWSRVDWWNSYLAHGLAKSSRAPGQAIHSVDLFSGVGGLTQGVAQGLAELGMELRSRAAADSDTTALGVFDANHSPGFLESLSVARLVDFKVSQSQGGSRFRRPPMLLHERWKELVGKVDLVLAGPPCQGHSNLNNHTRRDDPRNGLYLTVPAMATALGADHVIIENVESVKHDRGSVVETTVSLLESEGYRTTFGVLNCLTLGWPQGRKRFFLIASRTATPLTFDSLCQRLAAPVALDLRWAIGSLSFDSKGDFMSRKIDYDALTQQRIDFLFENDLYDLPSSERPNCHRNGTTYTSVYGRLRWDRPAPTITTGYMTMGQGRFVHPSNPRTLCPREAARLQGFPDNYWFGSEDAPPSRQSLGKWIGNAVPMPLGHAAAMALFLPTAQHGARPFQQSSLPTPSEKPVLQVFAESTHQFRKAT